MFEPPQDPPTTSLSTLAAGLVAVVFACFLAIGLPAQVLNLSWGLWFGEVFIFFGVPFIALRLSGRDPLRTTGADATTLRGTLFGFAVGLANYAAWAVPLMYGAQRLFPARWVELFDSSQVFKNQTTLELGVIVAGVSLAAPVCEEFLFRGVVQQGLSLSLPPPRAIVVTALLFSLFHLDPVGFVARFELGVVFGLLAWRSGSLWPAIGAHAANNLVSTSIFFASPDAAEQELAWWVPLLMFVVGNLVLASLLLWSRRSQLLAVAEPAEVTPLPSPGLFGAIRPWVLGALAAVLLLVSVDLRGVVLSVYDTVHPVKPASRSATAGEVAAHDQLRELRRRARSGEVPMEDYFQLRQLAADEGRGP